jgi:hypothetical protein
MPTGLILFKRLPYLRWRPKEGEQIIPPKAQADYPAFAEDFERLEQELMPHFRELDNEALRTQNQFRLEQVALIFGGALATTLGTIQAVLADAIWPGIVEAVLAAMLAAIALRTQALKAQERYFTNRLKAETLRGEYFLFLGRVGSYADDDYRIQQLIRRVADVKPGRERDERAQ